MDSAYKNCDLISLVFGGGSGSGHSSEEENGEGRHARIARRSKSACGGHEPTADDFTWSSEAVTTTRSNVRLIRKSDSSTDCDACAFENPAYEEEERVTEPVHETAENSNSYSSELLKLQQRDSSDNSSVVKQNYCQSEDGSCQHCEACTGIACEMRTRFCHDSRNITVIVTGGARLSSSCEGTEDETDGEENRIVSPDSLTSSEQEERGGEETFLDAWNEHTKDDEAIAGPSTFAVRHRPVKDSSKNAGEDGENKDEDKNKIVLHVPAKRREEREGNILDEWTEEDSQESSTIFRDYSNIYHGLWCRTDSPNYPVTRRTSTAPPDL